MLTSQKPTNGTPTGHKQTGPPCLERRRKSSMNALKHGMTAVKFDVLPTENLHEFHEHVDGWVEDLDPRNRVELGLAQVAARMFWKLQRADRIQTARVTAYRTTAGSRASEEIQTLGVRLFRDARGSPRLTASNRTTIEGLAHPRPSTTTTIPLGWSVPGSHARRRTLADRPVEALALPGWRPARSGKDTTSSKPLASWAASRLRPPMCWRLLKFSQPVGSSMPSAEVPSPSSRAS